MSYVGGKRSVVVVLALSSLFSISAVLAESVDPARVRNATDAFLMARSAPPTQGPKGSIRALATGLAPAGFREIRDDDGTVLAYVADLEPRGFVALSADTDIAPIVAYSFRASFPAGDDERNPLYRMLRADMKLRTKALAERPDLKTAKTAKLWELLAAGEPAEPDGGSFRQWPAEGTTSTGGWLETTWGQGAPFNTFCPLDPSDGVRSYVGCVATAFAQLVHYHRLCEVNFGPDDSYTARSGMKLDADGELYGFPSFTRLNGRLDDLRAKYAAGVDLNDVDIAALSFACGVAVGMDYGSDGSGAPVHAVRKAMVSPFGYYSADMYGGLTGTALVALQENMINGLPALLSFSPPDGWGGHVIVCDGYNTDGEYHLNYGWGKERPQEITDAWYRLPTAFLYRDCVITESILNIRPAPPLVEVDTTSLNFHAAPGGQSASQVLRIKNTVANLQIESISSPDGFLIALPGQEYAGRVGSFVMGSPQEESTLRVMFQPDRAGGYYGTLVVRCADGSARSVVLKGWAYDSSTVIAGGEVSGTWSVDRSPYLVTGNIRVPAQGRLVIEPGVKVFFMGSYGLTVGENAGLLAEGNEAQPIEFTAWNKAAGWGGLRFVGSGNDDVLSHCLIGYAKKEAGLTPESTSADIDLYGGAVYCVGTDLVIENCVIANNTGGMAGAVYCKASDLIIRNSVIANNTSVGGDCQCGGILCDDSGRPAIWNCTIVNNFPGGLFTSSWDGTDVVNTILWGNDRYQVYTDESAPSVTFCDVQGGYPGEGNIDLDPNFLDPTSGTGAEYDGASTNWRLRSTSPCINAGTPVADLGPTDLAGADRVFSDVIDLGAYENQSELPLMTAIPSGMVDAGFVSVDASTTVTVTLANTGKLDFEILDVSVPEGAFSVVAAIPNRLLTPGDSVQVTVRFQPTEEKVYTDTLLVRSTGSNASVMRVGLHGVGITGTSVPAGAISGTWRKENSPYTVTGDIRIPRGQTLTIEPGVVVKFAGHFGLTVGYRGTLRAVGTEQDRIVFTPIDVREGWYGIRFINSSSDDVLKYCTIEYAAKPRSGGGSFANLFGGGILCCSSYDDEPYMPLITSPTIDLCLIANNYARTGGGIMCYAGGNATITNCTIVDNYSDLDGGGIAMYYADCTISNNVIARNEGLVGGGVMNWMSVPRIRNNTLVGNRPSAMHLETTTPYEWMIMPVSVTNNIIWENEIWLAEEVLPDEYDIRYNDIQGGWGGVGNIAVDPLFADAENGDYHLKSQAGRWDPATESWITDSVTSPCIDAGNPSSSYSKEPEPNGQRVNLGAYGGTARASKSPSDTGGM